MSYRLLATALDDLDAIEDWVLANFGEAAASKALARIIETLGTLAEFPHAGLERPEVAPPPVRFFSSPPNWIIYEPETPILIHRIFPARTDIRDLNHKQVPRGFSLGSHTS